MSNSPDAIALFSGGLDSLLAAKLLEAQGLKIHCVHFITPFYGCPEKIPRWRKIHGLTIQAVDLGERFAEILLNYPAHGYGKNLNPCVDCKILQLRAAREIMAQTGAGFLATGEVLGQRPMSQRRDSLDVIRKAAGVGGLLLRPLSALLLPPTEAEARGLVDRNRLLDISGRSRTRQLELAALYGLAEIPSPAGGCRLTERENSRRYWQILKHRQAGGTTATLANDFQLANLGRQFWLEKDSEAYWLAVGRTAKDNEMLARSVRPGDVPLRVDGLPGPLAVARDGISWPAAILEKAAALCASYSREASKQEIVPVIASGARDLKFNVQPDRQAGAWDPPAWEEIRAEMRIAGSRQNA